MATLDPARPFVLLDDARVTGAADARLYRDPVEIIRVSHLDEVRPALARLRAASAKGYHCAGFLTYEAGLALEDRLKRYYSPAPDGLPLLWFGLFRSVERIASSDVPALLPSPASAWIGRPRPSIRYDAYAKALDQVQAFIAAGDIYQANLTFQATVPVEGDPLAIYARLRAASRMGWGGVIHTGDRWVLSASPELFFTLDDGRITARPMKGTARRGAAQAEDEAARQWLMASIKDRAENLMIVDLLRNDLSRVAAPGSVETPRLFEVETYPTIHQMTSTVEARLGAGKDVIDILEAIYPCGSITGAPKIRAMEVIAGVEESPRGLYTGAIGFIGPDGDAGFNVAIRTLVMAADGKSARLGLGSGIVADSETWAEWRECLAKAAFLIREQRPVDLIETMRFDPEDGIQHFDRHIARLEASARTLGFTFDRHAARNELQSACFTLREPARVRLLTGQSGIFAVETAPLPPPPETLPVSACIMQLPVAPSDFRLQHKTSDRGFYDEARKQGGCFETLFVDPDGFLTEGSFTSIFVERGGRLLTPPLSRGLLPGILRESLLAEERAIEADLTPADLAEGFFIGNAVRGLIPARLVAG